MSVPSPTRAWSPPSVTIERCSAGDTECAARAVMEHASGLGW